MAYGSDPAAAARRHYEAAALLYEPKGRRDVAGYLYGISAECALKYIMLRSGMLPQPLSPRDDPFYLHFPVLKTVLRDTAKGRYQGKLLQYATNAAFMNGWDVKMRYACSRDVLQQPIEKWKAQAERILQDIVDL